MHPEDPKAGDGHGAMKNGAFGHGKRPGQGKTCSQRRQGNLGNRPIGAGPAKGEPLSPKEKKPLKRASQPVEKNPGVRGPQCSSQRSRCVGPWGLPGAPLLTGLPPRSSRHWRRSALPSGGYHRIWRHKVNCPEGTREGPLGGARQIRKKPCVARVSLHSSLAAP